MWIVQELITILINKNYGKKRNELIQNRKNKSKRRGKIRNRTRKYRDWDMLVTIVGQLSEHIAEKKVNEMLNNK